MPKQNDMDMFKENIKRADTSRIAFPVLIALGLSHCFNDLLQSVVSAVYPILKDDLALASGGRRGLAQSLFQVGGNFGTSVGPLLVALIVAPHGMGNVAWFVVVSMLAFVAMVPICRWYSAYLTNLKTGAAAIRPRVPRPLPMGRTVFTIFIIMLLIFSKFIYMASLTNYYTFYLIHRFGVSVQMSQVLLFVFLVAMAIGTVVGGPVGDRYGRKTVIWVSILGRTWVWRRRCCAALVPD